MYFSLEIAFCYFALFLCFIYNFVKFLKKKTISKVILLAHNLQRNDNNAKKFVVLEGKIQNNDNLGWQKCLILKKHGKNSASL